MTIDPYVVLSAAKKCRPKIGVSSNIRFMRIFAGVPWTGGVKMRVG